MEEKEREGAHAARTHERRPKNKGRRKKLGFVRVLDRILGFVLATVLLGLAGGFGVEYVLVKGPSPTMAERFALTMLETRRFGFFAGVFLTDEELAAIEAKHYAVDTTSTDSSLIHIGEEPAPVPNKSGEEMPETEESKATKVYVDEDGDGVIVEEVVGSGYRGYMMIVPDPTRIRVVATANLGGVGETLSSLCTRYDAVGGINAGGFADDYGTGLGGYPLGLTVANGEYFNTDADPAYFMGFDREGILHVGYYSTEDVYNLGIVNGVTFGPTLIVNGVARSAAELSSGLNPRTAIGQRADGTVLMLVIDGRQVRSLGATYTDLANIMLEYGAVNASNLDGGSSTVMWFDGKIINSCSASTNLERTLPTAFIVTKEEK